MFLDRGSLWAPQVSSSAATLVKASQIDALIAREQRGRAGIAVAGHPGEQKKSIGDIGDINDSLWGNEGIWAARFFIRTVSD